MKAFFFFYQLAYIFYYTLAYFSYLTNLWVPIEEKGVYKFNLKLCRIKILLLVKCRNAETSIVLSYQHEYLFHLSQFNIYSKQCKYHILYRRFIFRSSGELDLVSRRKYSDKLPSLFLYRIDSRRRWIRDAKTFFWWRLYTTNVWIMRAG